MSSLRRRSPANPGRTRRTSRTDFTVRWRGHRLYPKRGVIRSQPRYDAERPSKFAGAFTQPAVLRGSALWNVAVVARSTIGLGLRTAHERSEELLAAVGLGARRCGRVQHVPLRVDAAFGQTRRAPGIVQRRGRVEVDRDVRQRRVTCRQRRQQIFGVGTSAARSGSAESETRARPAAPRRSS